MTEDDAIRLTERLISLAKIVESQNTALEDLAGMIERLTERIERLEGNQ